MPRPPFRWDPAVARYRDAAGRLVSAGWVRGELDSALLRRERRVRQLVGDLRSGRTSLATFRLEMRAMIKDVHLYAGAAARGGWDGMSPAAFGQVGRRIRDEYGFLERFVAEIGAGLPLDGRAAARAAQYVAAGRDTYHVAERTVMRSAGMTEERNVLHPAEHCGGPGSCVGETERGWVTLGTLIPIGRRVCRRGCKCTLEFRRQPRKAA